MTPYARYGKGLLGVYQDLCSISATLSDSRGTNFFHNESVASSWELIFAINICDFFSEITRRDVTVCKTRYR